MDWIKRFGRAHWASIVTLLISTFATLLFADFALSSIGVIRLSVMPPQKPVGYVQFDEVLGYDNSPSFPKQKTYFRDSSFETWSNRLGCFDEEYQGEKPYVLLVGDSFAWGWVPHEENWGKHIERMSGTRVLTCGVDGYGTIQEGIKAERIIKEVGAPKIILVSYLGANDIDDDRAFPNYVVYKGRQIHSAGTTTCEFGPCAARPEASLAFDAKLWFASHSVIYNLVQRKVYAPFLRFYRGGGESIIQEQNALPPLPDIHTGAMTRLQNLAKNNNAVLVVVLVPTKDDVRASSVYTNARMKEFLDTEGIQYIDLLPVLREQEKLPENPLYWTYDGHWNPAGNRVAGSAVAEYLIAKGLLRTMQE